MADDNVHHRVLSGLRWTVFARLTMQLITWGVTFFVVRLLSPTDYGLVAMATVVAYYLLMMGEMGLTSALVQRRQIDIETEQSIFGALLIAGLVLFCVSAGAAPLVARHFSDRRIIPLIVLVSAQFLVLPFSVLPQSRLAKDMRFDAMGIAALASATSGALVTLVGAYLGYGAYALIGGNLVQVLVRAIAINIMAPFLHAPRLNLGSLREMAAFSSKVLTDRTLWYWYNQFDTMIVGSWLGAALLGSYSVAKQLASIPLDRFGEVMNIVALPGYSAVQHDLDRVRETYVKTIRLTAVLVIPVFWGIALVASNLVTLVLGARWHSAIPVMHWLCVMLPLRAVDALASPMVTAIGKPGVSLRCTLVCTLIIIPAVAIGAKWQIVGVAAAWALGYPLTYLINARSVGQAVGLPLRRIVAPLLNPIVCGVVMAISVMALNSLISRSWTIAAQLACQVVTGAVAYALALALFARADGRELFGFVRRFFTGRRRAEQVVG